MPRSPSSPTPGASRSKSSTQEPSGCSQMPQAAPSSTGVSASCLSERTEEALELAKEAIELARRFGERGNEAKALLLLATAVVMDERSLDHIHGAWSPSEPASSRLRTTAHPKRFRSLLTSSFRRSCWRRSI